MLLPTRALLLFLSALLLATLAHALPGGGGVPKPTAPPMKPNERASWFCTHKYKVMYSHYKLNGRDWNKTEKEIRIKVEAAGMATRWEYDDFEDENGIVSFESSFNLPLGRASALGQQASMLLGINKAAKNATSGKKNVGVECPQICRKC